MMFRNLGQLGLSSSLPSEGKFENESRIRQTSPLAKMIISRPSIDQIIHGQLVERTFIDKRPMLSSPNLKFIDMVARELAYWVKLPELFSNCNSPLLLTPRSSQLTSPFDESIATVSQPVKFRFRYHGF